MEAYIMLYGLEDQVLLRCQFPSHVSIMSVQSQSKITPTGTSLVVRWLRIRLAM